MTNRIFGILATLLILLSLLFALRTVLSDGAAARTGDLTGPLLVWHSWSGARAEILAQSKTKFEELHPGLRVVLVAHPRDELYARYAAATANGFGPDLLVAPGEWLMKMLADDLIRPVDTAVEAQSIRWLREDTRRSLRSKDRLYGLPFGLRTQALFYNKKLVEQPAVTLDDLLAQAGAGAGVGIGSSFESALWGLGASGGHLYDDKGAIIVDVPGFTSWLTWLRNAQNNPAFVMGTNQDGLRELFVKGDLSYLVDDSDAVRLLASQMQTGTLAIRALPSGVGGAATPLLRTEAFFFSPVSSPRQKQTANALALFLVGKEQQTLLMRWAGLTPTHQDVRINIRLNPEIYAFALQAKTAIPWTDDPLLTWLLTTGDKTYVQALEGVLTPNEAANELAVEMASKQKETEQQP
ncbi:MAG: extracellular solute-binding protein [Caldilineaceae bacterium]|nr:extracellular solute-binding protein [Caldilineaceae bacterium]HRJ41944.1 extracellular solute-binding protein [Caldilineaceae bacterium]